MTQNPPRQIALVLRRQQRLLIPQHIGRQLGQVGQGGRFQPDKITQMVFGLGVGEHTAVAAASVVDFEDAQGTLSPSVVRLSGCPVVDTAVCAWLLSGVGRIPRGRCESNI
jgi:hypothetical protein